MVTKSAGNFNSFDWSWNECRPFKPKGGFKKDRNESQKPIQQRDGAKHIDLKALRKNDNPVRTEGNDKKKFEKKTFKKGNRPENNKFKRLDNKDPKTAKD